MLPKVYLTYAINEVVYSLRKDHKNMEWSALWRVEEIDGKMVVTDLYIPKQTNQTTHTEFDDPQLEEFWDYLWDNDRSWEVNQWRLWLHSHHTMPPFWSWTDSKTREQLCTETFYNETKKKWWALSIVVGKDYTFHWTVDYCVDWMVYSSDIDVDSWLYDGEVDMSDVSTDATVHSHEDLEWIPEYIKDSLLTWEETIKKIEAKKKRDYEKIKNDRTELAHIEYERDLIDKWVLKLFDAKEYIKILWENEKKPVKQNTSYYKWKKQYATQEEITDAWFIFDRPTYKYIRDWVSYTYHAMLDFISNLQDEEQEPTGNIRSRKFYD